MRTIAIALAGGGSGKSTTTVNLAHELMARGYEVTVIDGDPQSSTTLLCHETPSAAPLDDEPVMVDVTLGLTRHDTPPHGTLLLFRSGRSLSTASRHELEAQIARVPANTDVLLIDTAPGLGPSSRAAIAAADLVVAPVRPAPVSLSSLADTYDTVTRLGRTARLRVVLTLVKSRRATVQRIAAKIGATWPGALLGTRIPDEAACESATSESLAVRRFAPRSQSALAYRALADEVLRELGMPPRVPVTSPTQPEPSDAAS